MDFTPIPVTVSASGAPQRCIVRGQRLVQVKFVALPQEMVSDTIFVSQKAGDRPPFPLVARAISVIFFLIHRVIGRLVAARP